MSKDRRKHMVFCFIVGLIYFVLLVALTELIGK